MIHRKLTKSLVLAGLQCHKQLWWRVNDPEAPELKPRPDDVAADRHRCRLLDLAREQFGTVEHVEQNGDGVRSRIRATDDLLAGGTRTIVGATFEFCGVAVVVDILARNGHGWDLIAVRPAEDVEPEHLPDLAIQAYVIRGAGLEVEHCAVLHPDGDGALVRRDLTQEVLEALPAVGGEVQAQDNMLFGPLPLVPVGPHCREPRECPFIGRCHETTRARLTYGRLRLRPS